MDDLFTPPFSSQLLLKRRQIRKELLAQGTEWLDKKIAILGGSTTYDIRQALELFLLDQGIRPLFYESGHCQYWQDVMFQNDALLQFQPDVIYIHTSNRNILKYPVLSNTKEEVEELFQSTYRHFAGMWGQIEDVYGCTVIQNNFEYPYWRLQGNREAADIRGSVNFITRLNLAFAEYAQEHGNFFINDINYLSADYGLEKWGDPFYWYMYKYALAIDAIPVLAHSVANIIKSLYGKNKKALALDLDNTLWGGIIGDEGVENLKIGPETPAGQAYSEFQEYLKAHRQLGVILNVISKNDSAQALSGLNHPDMVLKLDDFVMVTANWEPKSQNLIDMAHALSISTDSFVFVDDNPAEREIVRQQVEGAAVAEIGSAPERFIRAIDRMGYFEATTISTDDALRGEMYHQNTQRARMAEAFADYGEYLRSLEMKADIAPFTPLYFARIAQLSNKSNQFNLTTRRYTQAEIKRIAEDEGYITLYGRLVDKFGDNGVVSIVIGRQSGVMAEIDLWAMSCRVLKRGMESAMMDAFVKACRARGVQKVIGYYMPTAKNGMVKEFFAMFGYKKIYEDHEGNTKWELQVDDYRQMNDVIEGK